MSTLLTPCVQSIDNEEEEEDRGRGRGTAEVVYNWVNTKNNRDRTQWEWVLAITEGPIIWQGLDPTYGIRESKKFHVT